MLNDKEIEEIVSEILINGNIKRNITLHKYYSLERFLASLMTNKFTFQKPKDWEDPFEDFMSKLVNNYNDEKYNIRITNNIYAMSTINKTNECDGMWTNFAQKTGVLIHIKVKKILDSIIRYLLDNQCCNNKNIYMNNSDIKKQLIGCIKIRKIEYLNDKDIALKFVREAEPKDSDFSELSYEMLSIKRKEFEYENEYRIFLNQELLNLEEDKYLEVGYLKDSIEKIIISPRLPLYMVKKLKCDFIIKYSIPLNIIEQSNLYNFEHFRKTYNL